VAQSGAVPAFGMRSLGTAIAHERLESYETESITLLPLALLAFQFGGQIVTSRVLGFNEVPTNVLTSLYCDLFRFVSFFSFYGSPSFMFWNVPECITSGLVAGLT